MTPIVNILLSIWLGVTIIGIVWLYLVVEKFKRRESYNLPLNTNAFIHRFYIKEKGGRFDLYMPGFTLWILWPVSVPVFGLMLLCKCIWKTHICNRLISIWCFSKEERITIALGIEKKNK